MWMMIVAAALLADPQGESVSAKGTLVVVGGGPTTLEIVEKALDLAGGSKAKVAVIAEANRENGPASLAAWRGTKAARVSLINVQQPALATKLICEADLIWMPGGLQGGFMNGVRGTDIAETIRQRYRDGAIVGGTSAGAAVMSKVMIGGRSDLDSLRAGSTPYLVEGLALWPEVIVDQHFLQKGRFNRLTLAVLDHPDLLGIGIDEETAVVVHGRKFEVIGNNNVTVLDARKASREKLVQGEPAAARNVKIHVLRAKMKFDFDE